MEAPRPVSLRITRPYDHEDAFVAAEARSLGRAWVVLAGTGPHPIGEVIRFEIALSNGVAAVRGEGKVIAYRVRGDGRRPAGLELKLTKLDARSKALLERAAAARGSIRPAARSLPPPTVSPPPPAPVPSFTAPPPSSEGAPPSFPAAEPGSGPRAMLRSGARIVAPPPNREEMLARLRDRAKTLASIHPAKGTRERVG